jgi:hypothetical protein
LPQVALSAPAGSPRQKRGDRAGFPSLRSGFTGEATSPVRPVSYATVALQPSAAEATLTLDDGPTVVVPDFGGKTLRQVAEECQELGLDLNVRGSGLAIDQMPPVRAQVPAGSKVWVRFAR